jgi:hypothetical protein
MSASGSQNSWLNSEPVPSGVSVSASGFSIVVAAPSSSAARDNIIVVGTKSLLPVDTLAIGAVSEKTVITVNASAVFSAGAVFAIFDTVSSTTLASVTFTNQTNATTVIDGSQLMTLVGQLVLDVGQEGNIELLVTNTGPVSVSAWGAIVYSQPA